MASKLSQMKQQTKTDLFSEHMYHYHNRSDIGFEQLRDDVWSGVLVCQLQLVGMCGRMGNRWYQFHFAMVVLC